MFAWFTANLATILIGAALLAAVAGIIASMVKNKKKGKSSCGCGCESCALSEACHGKKDGTRPIL